MGDNANAKGDNANAKSDIANNPPPPGNLPPPPGFEYSRPSPQPSVSRYLRICPHRTITWEQLNFLARRPMPPLPLSLDILQKHSRPHLCPATIGPFPHHAANFRILPLSITPFNNTWKHAMGFEVNASWEMLLVRDHNNVYSKAIIQTFLYKSHITLCPHGDIASNKIVDAIFHLIPLPVHPDNEMSLNCGRCSTIIKISRLDEKRNDGGRGRFVVKVKRPVGLGLLEIDPMWWRQCVSSDQDVVQGNEWEGVGQMVCRHQYLRGIKNPAGTQEIWDSFDEMEREADGEHEGRQKGRLKM